MLSRRSFLLQAAAGRSIRRPDEEVEPLRSVRITGKVRALQPPTGEPNGAVAR